MPNQKSTRHRHDSRATNNTKENNNHIIDNNNNKNGKLKKSSKKPSSPGSKLASYTLLKNSGNCDKNTSNSNHGWIHWLFSSSSSSTKSYKNSNNNNNKNQQEHVISLTTLILLSISSIAVILYFVQSSQSFQTSFQSFKPPKLQAHITTYKTKKDLLEARSNHRFFKIAHRERLRWRYTHYDIDTFWEKNLRPLLIKRVSGTEGLLRAEAHILKQLPSFYQIRKDIFKDTTPHGEVEFRNIIAMSNPVAERNLVLACHHDSKWWPNKKQKFIGATDSSVPCAMILQLAQQLGDDVFKSRDLGLMLIFLDGEEAVLKWTSTDSVYGSRHLAEVWSKEVTHSDGRTAMDKIDLFVLLDLLGAPKPHFHHDAKFAGVNKFYNRLAALERNSQIKRLLKKDAAGEYYFSDKSVGKYSLGIDDDHMPFYRKGCSNIIHWIPYPFPSCWHNIEDNEEVLDRDTIYNLQILLNIWTAEYLGLAENANDTQ